MDFIAFLSVFAICMFAAIIFMSGVFVIGRRIRRYDLVDVAWGLVFILIAMTSLLFSDDISPLQVVVLGMMMVWGLRLSIHIYRRFRSTTNEDRRYVELRKKWRSENEAISIFFRIFMVQAVLATVICLPVIFINWVDGDIKLGFAIVGISLWAVGFLIESIADWQLRSFVANQKNKGQLMMRGLWRYSRHPNYFGELTMWWGIGIVALGIPYGWIGLIGPLVISYIIIFVSGVPPTEAVSARKPGWDNYRRRTSVLIPWFTKTKV